MPRYTYTTGDGSKSVTLSFPLGQAPPEVDIEGCCAAMDFSAGASSVGVPFTKGWPMECPSSGVHPSQAKEAYEESIKHGVPTEFNPVTGDAVYRDARHRRNYLKTQGLFDKASYY